MLSPKAAIRTFVRNPPLKGPPTGFLGYERPRGSHTVRQSHNLYPEVARHGIESAKFTKKQQRGLKLILQSDVERETTGDDDKTAILMVMTMGMVM